MKIKILTLIAVSLTVSGYAQTKGTNALSLGITTYSNKTENITSNGISASENKFNSFTLGYGAFIKDNSKIGLELTYGNNSSETAFDGHENKSYGGNVSYQHYYPLVKTLYAYAGGRGGYMYSKTSPIESATSDQGFQYLVGKDYSAGAYGGITWFLSKRFAFETSLLSANMVYSSTKQENNEGNNSYTKKTTNFNLTTQGFIDDLGFKIYLLF